MLQAAGTDLLTHSNLKRNSERQDKSFSLQIQRLEVDLKLNRGSLFFPPWVLMG